MTGPEPSIFLLCLSCRLATSGSWSTSLRACLIRVISVLSGMQLMQLVQMDKWMWFLLSLVSVGSWGVWEGACFEIIFFSL